jgi:molybdenum cofactor cytidylyltransferase
MNKSENEKSVGAVILAAGYSSRMKIPKSFLRYDEKSVFIDKIIDSFLEFECNKIIITINEEINGWVYLKNKYKDNDSIEFVENQHPEYERFFSIKTGLENIENLDYCFIQNTDNPFIDIDILNKIFKNRFDEGYTVPIYQRKGGHPILLGKKVIQKIKDSDNFNVNFKDFLNGFSRKNVDVDSNKIHININTQEEYNKYFERNEILDLELQKVSTRKFESYILNTPPNPLLIEGELIPYISMTYSPSIKRGLGGVL